jgi:ribosomal protein L18E
MPPKRSRIKYPGWLGKTIPQSNDFVRAVLSGHPKAFDLWMVDLQNKTLQELLRFYEIPSHGTEADRWYALAWRLALDHVPAMRLALTRGRGRPATAIPEYLHQELPPRKRGAPKKWDDQLLLALVERVDEIKAAATQKGRRLSDNAALEELLKEKARQQGTAEIKVSRINKSKPFTRWRKQLQIARKKFPQNSTT